jgi:hypothetical protein
MSDGAGKGYRVNNVIGAVSKLFANTYRIFGNTVFILIKAHALLFFDHPGSRASISKYTVGALWFVGSRSRS